MYLHKSTKIRKQKYVRSSNIKKKSKKRSVESLGSALEVECSVFMLLNSRAPTPARFIWVLKCTNVRRYHTRIQNSVPRKPQYFKWSISDVRSLYKPVQLYRPSFPPKHQKVMHSEARGLCPISLCVVKPPGINSRACSLWCVSLRA